jgi:phosphonopyruvate decarboxylase
VPTLVITTWRGEPGIKDEPQHEQMGRIMHQLLDTLEIPWLPFPKDEAEIPGTMAAAEASLTERQRPFALVMSKDSVAPHKLASRAQSGVIQAEVRHHPTVPASGRLTRTAALQVILESLTGREAVVATTGMTGRELFTLADQPNYLYVVGGMGTASAIGFGVARALPKQPVVVLDGDGAALMKMGSLVTIGYYQPRNFLHVILDNECHDSTGGQQTSSPTARFAEIAAAANYQRAFTADRPEDVRQCVQYLRTAAGPSLLHVKIQPGSPKEIGRPSVKPHQVKERFMDFLRTANPGKPSIVNAPNSRV